MNLIKDIKDRIQFLVTVDLFFLTLMSDLVSRKSSLAWGIAVALSIVNYLLIERVKKTDQKSIRGIRLLVDINLFYFVFPIILLIMVQGNPLPGYYFGVFFGFALGTLVFTTLTVFAILSAIPWGRIVKGS